MGTGYLVIELRAGNNLYPLTDTRVLVRNGEGEAIELFTDNTGNTQKIAIVAPEQDNSLSPGGSGQIYSICDAEVPRTGGYMKKIIHGVHIFDTVTSILRIQMMPSVSGENDSFNTEEIFIPKKHGINIDSEQQDNEAWAYDLMSDISVQEIPLANEVSIPTYVTVHLGTPNAAANNIRVTFKDYIKNITSGEIYPTWPEASIRANIYAQISFALNRLYTVWYRSRGYEFDLTCSAAFDQYFVYGREIYDNISDIVDGIFNSFIRRPGKREPFFASYCNGTTTACEGLSQWGTVSLANEGYSPLQILRHYYPNDIQIVQSNNFTEHIAAYGGVPLKESSTGNEVRDSQLYLNKICGNYPSVTNIPDANGYFDSETAASVKEYQRINNMDTDGIIGKKTWYGMCYTHAAINRFEAFKSESEKINIEANPSPAVIQVGSRGEDVARLQILLNMISEFYPMVPVVIKNDIFTEDTKRAVIEFQSAMNLKPDGIVGTVTWNMLYELYKAIKSTIFEKAAHLKGEPQKAVISMTEQLNRDKLISAFSGLTEIIKPSESEVSVITLLLAIFALNGGRYRY